MASTDITAVMDEFRSKFTKLYETGELKALSELYTEDCRIAAPGKEMRQGRGVVVKAMEAMKSQGIVKIVINPVEVAAAGDQAYEVSENSYLNAEGTAVDVKNMLVVFKKIEGAYFIKNVCFNSK